MATVTPASWPPHPYAEFVHRVDKPARYLGGEYGSSTRAWDSAKARVCLAFPDVYDIGMSHLGLKILYNILNHDPRTLAERCFAPWVDMERELIARNLPLVSLESAHKLADFDVVGFSLQFELTYTNILTMLDLGRIPLRGSARGESDPLIIAGGPAATHPEPLAMFIDAFVVGDGEERTTELALLWTELREKGVSRTDRLRAIGKLRGVYVPSLYSVRTEPQLGLEVVDGPEKDLPFPIVRNVVGDINEFPFPDNGPVGGPEAIFDRMSIEIARGCTQGCRFCQAGMIYRPVRERDPAEIVDTVVKAVNRSGYDEVSLTSLSTADYSCLAPLVRQVTEKLSAKNVSLGVSSLRAYGLEEAVLDDMRRVRASGITFAPEAGSQRMRDVINKNISLDNLMTTAERVCARGWDKMKLYFMIGLPTENECDVREIVQVGKRVREIGGKVRRETNQGGPPKITVSVSTFVPKPHTPFQWCAMDRQERILEKQAWLKDEGRHAKSVEIRLHHAATSWLEGVFARGDRKLGRVLERAQHAGCRFDSWEDQMDIDLWMSAFRAEGIEPENYLGTIPVGTRLPWDHIDVGLEDGFLNREYRKALKNRLSPPCSKGGKAASTIVRHTNIENAESEKDNEKLVCYNCGIACDLSAMQKTRQTYLDRLDSLDSLDTKASQLPNALAQAPKPKGPRQPPRIVQGEARRYRFVYEKIGPAAFLSHLDVLRALPRSFRRLQIPIFYSSGFHPKPEMTFSPALSLGVSSLAEVVDAKLAIDVDPTELASALSGASAQGLVWKACVRLGPHDSSVARLVDAARYAVAIARKELHAMGGETRLAAEIQRLAEASEHLVIRRFERSSLPNAVPKTVNVKKFLRRITAGDPRATALLRDAGVHGDFVTLLIDVDITPEGGVKVSEVIEALMGNIDGWQQVFCPSVRIELGLRDGERIVSPIDLATIRLRSNPSPRLPH
ncbi:MAG: TIGR03960 family B12-binding radical SAM protein [Polyangiaceae bacterium]|nr:TIGR03960 family B12-binding radical SAM protein [Polyangiaceae bacterium]